MQPVTILAKYLFSTATQWQPIEESNNVWQCIINVMKAINVNVININMAS
jgi:hypothetical protein